MVIDDELEAMPDRRYAVYWALLDGDEGMKYREVATSLDMSLGTVYEHLRRMRLNEPHVYAYMMKVRAKQLKVRSRRRAARTTLTTRWT